LGRKPDEPPGDTVCFDFNPKPLRVICADDEEPSRELLTGLLGKLGHTVVSFPDGEQALAAIVADPGEFDVLITDNEMGRMNGLDLVREVRKTKFTGKIVVISAYLEDGLREKYQALGVSSSLGKPCSERALLEALKN